MSKSFCYEFPHAAVTATVIVQSKDCNKILLIKRGHEPFNGSYCFPGGFLNAGQETIEEAGARELKEETAITIDPNELQLVDTRSAIDRDERGHVIDIGLIGTVEHVMGMPGDDAYEVCWVQPDQIANMPLAFDHNTLWERANQKFSPRRY